MIADELKILLADTYALYLKSQNYHWNVEGPNFKPLHEMFEEQYADLAGAIDVISELIRGLGYKARGSFEIYAKLTSIKPADENTNSTKMLKDLVESHNFRHFISYEAYPLLATETRTGCSSSSAW